DRALSRTGVRGVFQPDGDASPASRRLQHVLGQQGRVVFAATGAGVPVALHTLFDRAAARISRVEATSDPAGVSGPLKLLADRSVVATRLRKAADGLAEASATTPTT